MTTITGIVVKQKINGTEILQGMAVKLDTKSVLTNEKGRFNFWGISNGVYILLIRDSMFAPFSKRITVNNQEKIDVGTIQLRWCGL